MNTKISEVISKIRTAPWVVLVIIAMACAMLFPIFPDGTGGYTTLAGYVTTWFGSIFKTMSGGVIGFWFCRKVLKVDLSEIPDLTARSIAGLGCGLVIAAFILGVAKGT